MLKLLIVRNRFTKKLDFKKGLDWFKTRTPLAFELEEMTTDYDFGFEKYENESWTGVGVDSTVKERLRLVVPRNTYHAVVFIYGNKPPEPRVSVTNWNPLFPETDFIQLVKTNDKGLTLNHELFHTFFYNLARKGVVLEDPMDRVQINGKIEYYYKNSSLTASPSNRTIALERLAPWWELLSMTTPTYKWFKPSEIVGLKDELVSILDKARELAGTPFIITSGFRTPERNKEVGGVANSAHLTGQAVDLACTDGLKRTKILTGLLNCGTPVFIEVAKGHIHVDIKPENHPMGSTIVEPNDN